MNDLCKTLTLAGLMGLTLTGCEEPAAPAGLVDNQTLRMDDYCVVDALQPSLRHTFLILDAALVQPAQTAEEFAARNSKIRDAIMAFSDPTIGIDSGRMEARERVTVMMVPATGSAPRQVFTGCVPGLSADERALIAHGESGASRFFTGGFEQQLAEDVDSYRAMIVGALISISRSGVERRDSPMFFESLNALGPLLRSTDTVARVVLISDAIEAQTPQDLSAARLKGLVDGETSTADFGNSEVMIMGKGGEQEFQRAYFGSLLLTMNGNLSGWSAVPAGLSAVPAPKRVLRYSGTAAYPAGSDELIQVRIGLDSNGKLVSSWLILLGLQERAIPMTGQAVCQENGDCQLRSDRGDFAQAWVARRGAEPIFDNEAPFGGMREWSMAITGRNLSGEVFDSAVDQVGQQKGKRSIAINAGLQQKASF